MARTERRDRTYFEGRPVPDEADSPTDVSSGGWFDALKRAAKKGFREDTITDSAAAVTYYAFLAIPATLLVAVGLFGLVADPSTIRTLVEKLGTVMPGEATALIEESLTRVTGGSGGGLATLVGIGFALALWTSTGAVNAVMRALNNVYDRDESRGFVKQRLVALAIMGLTILAFLLVFGLLVLGPQLSGWIGGALGVESWFDYLWWIAQWPILLAGLLLAFAGAYFLGPDVEQPSWKWISPGAVVGVVTWLIASGLFAFYVANFGSYNKAWGSIAAVIIMLTWIWLSALALLFGAELNAQLERRRGAESDR